MRKAGYVSRFGEEMIKPAILRGLRGEFLAQISGIQLDARSTGKDVQEGLARMSTRILTPPMHFQTGQLCCTTIESKR